MIWIFLLIGITFICTLSTVFIFKKEENTEWWHAIIPFYGAYKYFKICNLPFWTFFVPVINILTCIFSVYCLCKQYGCNRIVCSIAVIFPFLIMPYIAFSNLKNKNKKIKFNYLRNNKDIDNLEKKLINDETFLVFENNFGCNQENQDFKVDEDYFDSDSDYITDEEVYFDELETDNKNSNEMIELNDDIEDYELNYSAIDNLEENLKENSKVDIQMVSNKKIVEEDTSSKEAIAFGGEKKIENVPKAKLDELKCDRCGSSLVGSNGYCPGCGKKL